MPSNQKTITEILDVNEFELPVGYTDSEGTFHKTVKLQEMTGYVDEAMADAKVRSNPGKMITEALFGVVESIGTMKKVKKDDIKSLKSQDRDFLLLMNHKVSIGDDVEYDEECESCRNRFTVEGKIDSVPVTYAEKGEFDEIKLTLPNGFKNASGQVFKEMSVSLADGRVQEMLAQVAQENPAKAETMLLSHITEEIKGMDFWNFETFQKLGKKDRRHITKEISKIKVGADIALNVTCPSCGKEQKSVIPMPTLLGE